MSGCRGLNNMNAPLLLHQTADAVQSRSGFAGSPNADDGLLPAQLSSLGDALAEEGHQFPFGGHSYPCVCANSEMARKTTQAVEERSLCHGHSACFSLLNGSQDSRLPRRIQGDGERRSPVRSGPRRHKGPTTLSSSGLRCGLSLHSQRDRLRVARVQHLSSRLLWPFLFTGSGTTCHRVLSPPPPA